MRSYIKIMKSHRVIMLWMIIQIICVICMLGYSFQSRKTLTISKDETVLNADWKEYEDGDHLQEEIKNISLTSGSYNVHITFDVDDVESYRDQYGLEEPFIAFSCDDYPMGFYSENKIFAYGDTSFDTRVNIHLFSHVRHLNVTGVNLPLNYSISQIDFTENTVYRATLMIGLIIFFVVVDLALCFYYQVLNDKDYKRIIFHIAIACVSVIACAPILRYNSPTGDDYIFHLSRINELAHEIINGNLPVRIFERANNGYGYASPLFYCDSLLSIPALFYIGGCNIRICYNIYVAIINIFTIMTTDYMFKRIYGKEKYIQRFAGIAIYTLSYYRIVNIYTRSAVGEYTAMLFLPLIAVGVYGICHNDKVLKEDIVCIVVGATGIIQCHILSVEIVCLVVGIYMIVNLKRWFKWDAVKKLLLTVLLICGLNAWFIIPMIESWNMNLAVFNRNESIQRYGLYVTNILSVLNRADGSAHGIGAVLLLGVALATIILVAARNSLEEKAHMILKESVVISIICLFISTAYFPWDILTNSIGVLSFLTSIQFPWRFLEIVSLTGSIATVIGLEEAKRYLDKNYESGWGTGIICITVVAGIIGLGFYYNDLPNYTKLSPKNYVFSTDIGIKVPEYILFPEDYELDFDSMLEVLGNEMKQYRIVSSEGIEAEIIDHRKHLYYIRNNNACEAYIQLPIMNYDNWNVIDENGIVLKNLTKEFGHYLIELEIPAGFNGRIRAEYIEPIGWHIAEIISIITVAFLVILWIIERSKNKRGCHDR